MTVSLLQRNPVVMNPPSSIEREYAKYRQNLEAEKARGTFNIGNAAKGGNNASASVAAAEVAVPEVVELNEQVGPKDLSRKLNRKLYLCVKDRELGDKWTLPMSRFNPESAIDVKANEEPALHTHTQSFLSSVLAPSEKLQLYHLGVAPVAFHLEKYSDRIAAPFGAKHFFFRSQLISGKIRVLPEKYHDYGWFSKEELQEKLSSEMFEAIEPVISD